MSAISRPDRSGVSTSHDRSMQSSDIGANEARYSSLSIGPTLEVSIDSLSQSQPGSGIRDIEEISPTDTTTSPEPTSSAGPSPVDQPIARKSSLKRRTTSLERLQLRQDRSEESLNTVDEGASTQVHKRRSIQFSDNIAEHAAPTHWMEQPSIGRDEVAESSADEQTAIIGRERGGARSYGVGNGTSGDSANNGDGRAQETISGTSIGREIRRRRKSRSGSRTAGSHAEGEESLWKRMTAWYGSVELENKGSVARDHLALERTFLAWLRTSLSFASIGIAVTQLFRLNTSIAQPQDPDSSAKVHLRNVGKPLGATFIGISIIILFIGFHRYFESQHYVIRGKFPAGRGSIAVVALIAGALIVASLVLIIAVAPRSFEK